jgi:hypothetical protein
MGLGTIASISQVNSTSVAVITTAEYAPGNWSGMEGALCEFFISTLATKRGATAPGTATAVARIRAVDLEARTVTFEADDGDTHANIDLTAWNTAVAATDAIFFKTALIAGPTHHSFRGLHKIITDTSGNLFMQSTPTPGNYSLWKGNSIAAGGNLSFEIIQRAVAKAMGKGLDEGLVLYINPLTWALLLTDQAGLRRHGDPNKTARYEIGAESIQFYSQTGPIEIKSSIYVKEGYGYLVSPELWSRIGSTDFTFKTPGSGEDFFFQHPTKAGFVLRCYLNVALFSEAIGKATIITGIDNS